VRCVDAQDREVLFLDVEGEGERADRHNYSILTPSVVICDVILLNMPGYPGPNDTLQRLKVLYELTKRLKGHDGSFQLCHGTWRKLRSRCSQLIADRLGNNLQPISCCGTTPIG
jgi:hypothetical protein